ncbi:MAG: hypothetical protein SGPRY_005637, partial [Prymnesium sp.]
MALALESSEAECKLGGAALLSRVSRCAEGAKHTLQAGGAHSLVAVWEAKHSAASEKVLIEPLQGRNVGDAASEGKRWHHSAPLRIKR